MPIEPSWIFHCYHQGRISRWYCHQDGVSRCLPISLGILILLALDQHFWIIVSCPSVKAPIWSCALHWFHCNKFPDLLMQEYLPVGLTTNALFGKQLTINITHRDFHGRSPGISWHNGKQFQDCNSYWNKRWDHCWLWLLRSEGTVISGVL